MVAAGSSRFDLAGGQLLFSAAGQRVGVDLRDPTDKRRFGRNAGADAAVLRACDRLMKLQLITPERLAAKVS